MTGPRTYGDPCGVARALDVIGERWALLIVRELLAGPRRFTDLRAALAASPNVLSQRLGELESAGVVTRGVTRGAHYALTAWGLELHPVLLKLEQWGSSASNPAPQSSGPLSVDALMLALQSAFACSAPSKLRATLELRVDDHRFTADVHDDTLAVAHGAPPRADSVIAVDAETLRRIVFGERKLSAVSVELQGDARLARKFLERVVRA